MLWDMNMKLFLSFTVAALMQSVVWAEGAFEGWALNSGRGEDSGEALMVEGDGKSDNAWLSPPMAFEAGGRTVCVSARGVRARAGGRWCAAYRR
jgi:hypothetical protein